MSAVQLFQSFQRVARRLRPVFLVAAACAAGAGAHAQPGVTDSEVVVGQFAAFSGPAEQLGQRVRAGMAAYFRSVNESGGVHGRRIRLVTRDDGYESERAKTAVRELIARDKVFALAGSVGTPTGLAALPEITRERVPLVGMVTGAGALREPLNPLVFHVRAGYDQETSRIVQHLATLGVRRIAVFHQQDAFGAAGLAGVNAALAGHTAMKLVAVGTVERNSVDVQGAIDRILPAHPQAIVQVSAYKSSAAFIRAARTRGFQGQFFNLSFVGSAALAGELGSAGTGVVISQVVPSPFVASNAVVREYRQRMAAAGDEAYDFSSMEGYLIAKVFVEGLRRAGRNLTREGFTAALESLHDWNMGGFTVSYSPANHSGSSFIDLTILSGSGRFVS